MVERSINAGIVFGIITLSFGFFGQTHWALDILSHFRVYYLFFFLFLSCVSLIFSLFAQLAVSGAFTIFILSTLLRFYIPLPDTDDRVGLKVCSINLLASNQQYDKVLNYISEEGFDIVVFLEMNERWKQNLNILQNDFPYKELRPGETNFGIGIMSKIPLTEVATIGLSSQDFPTLVAKMMHENRPLTLIATHALPPVSTAKFETRNRQFLQLNQLVRSAAGEVLLIGDLNCSGFSPNFELLTRQTSLTDTRIGRGVQPSWKATPLIRVPLDHALVTDGIETLSRTTGPDVGSDHVPVSVEIDWK